MDQGWVFQVRAESRLRGLLRQVVRAQRRHWERNLGYSPRVVSMHASSEYWILICQSCSTIHLVIKLSSSALRGPTRPKRKYSFVNPS